MQAALEFYKTVVQHIAQPTFAGFKNNLCTDNFLYVLKRIAPEKVPILLDEYALECGGRRNTLLEELHTEPDVAIEDMLRNMLGKGTGFFALVGEAGSGKSAFLRHMTWKLLHRPETFASAIMDDVSLAYWNLTEDEVDSVSAANRNPIIGVYIRSSDLWRVIQNTTKKTCSALDLIIDAASATFRRLVRDGKFSEDEEPAFRSHLRCLLQTYRTFLLIDSLDLVPSSGRASMLSLIYLLSGKKLPSGFSSPVQVISDVNIFRTVVSSRPCAMFQQTLPGDVLSDAGQEGDWVFLFLDKLFSLQLKEKMFESIIAQNKLTQSQDELSSDNMAPGSIEAQVHSKILRSLRSPSTIFLMAQFRESSFTPVSVYDLFDGIVGLLKQRRRKVTSVPPIAPKHERLLGIVTGKSLFDGIDMDRMASLFGLIYQCLIPASSRPDFTLQKEATLLIQYLLRDQQEKREIWDALLTRFRSLVKDPELNEYEALAELIWHYTTQELAEWNLCHTLDTGELLFFDEQVVQFLCARFLVDEEFSQPIMDTWARLYEIDPIQFAVNMFTWQSSFYLCSHHWNFVYDLVGTKKGPIWLSQRILPPDQSDVFEWLKKIRLNYGVDTSDLGQIRFYRLLRGFALQQEDRVLLRQRHNAPQSFVHSSQEDVEVANLKEAFGMTFVSILEDNPSAIIHIEKPPVSTFGCFSQNAITIIIDKLVQLLSKGNILVIADLLLSLDKNNLLSEQVINRIRDIVASPETDYKPLRPALRFLTKRTPHWQHMSVVVEALAARDQDTQGEAADALVNMATMALGEIMKRTPNDGSRPNFLLYEEKDWKLLINSAVSLLMDFVDLDIHRTSKSAHYYDNAFEPKCRLAQCHHLPSLIPLLESNNPGTRLVPFILLGNTIRSNMYDREVELKNISSQLLLLDALGRVYKPPEGIEGRNVIDEITKSDYQTKAIAFVFLELFGEQAAKVSIALAEDLIKNKVDLLQQLTTWLWARIDAPTRRRLIATALSVTLGTSAPFSLIGMQPVPGVTIPIKLAPLVHRDVLYLSTRVDYTLQQMSELDLTLVLTYSLLPALTGSATSTKLPVMLQRAALRFLDRSVVQSCDEVYKIIGLEKIMDLLDKYFNLLKAEPVSYDPNNTASPQVFIEYLLRIILDVLNYENGRYRALAVETLLVQNARAKLLAIYRHSISTPAPLPTKDASKARAALTASGKLAETKMWFGKVLIIEVLKHLVPPTSPDVLEFLTFLGAQEPELRNNAVEVLRKADASYIPKLIERVLAMLEAEADPFIRRSCVVLLGALGRRKEPAVRDAAIESALKLLQHEKPVRQELGVSALSLMGRNATVLEATEQMLMALLQRIADAAQSTGLSRDDIALTSSLVECAPAIGLSSPQLIECMLKLLLHSHESSLRIAVFLSFKQLANHMPKDQLLQHESMLTECLRSPEGYVRELALKIIRCFGSDTIQRCVDLLLSCLNDQEPFVRNQAVKALSELVTEETKQSCLALIPHIVSRLLDKNPLVVVQALRFLCRFKSKNLFTGRKLVLPLGSPSSQLSNTEATESEETASMQDEDVGDTFYIKEVIAPNLDKIVQLLYKRRFRFHLPIKTAVLACLGETPFLHQHLHAYSEMLNSENVSTLVEFSDTFKSLGPQVLQYVPPIINTIKPGSPLVKTLVRLLQKHERQLDPATCNRLFGLDTIMQMMKNKDANVRKAAVMIMGKKVLEKPRHILVLVQMWADKNNKVRKEVMDVLGDIGRTNPSFINLIMDAIDTDSVTSVLVWRFLSKSWGVLIEASPDTFANNDSPPPLSQTQPANNEQAGNAEVGGNPS